MRILFPALSAVLVLATMTGCKPVPEAPKDPALESRLAAKADVDPEVARALEDPILVDPDLVGQANRGVIQPHNPPATGAVPQDPSVPRAAGERPDGPSLADRAQAQGSGRCGDGLTYDLSWSARLPADVPMPSGSQVEEAAGLESPQCHLRAVTFTNAASPADMLAFYQKMLRAAGYGVTVTQSGPEQMVKAIRPGGAAVFLLLTAGKKRGTIVDLITTTGR